MNWYIGQEIVCIKSHSKNAVVKDRIYTIKGIRSKCCHNQLDVGVTTDITNFYCRSCGHEYNDIGVWWISEKLFAPLMDISELESILNQQKEKV